MDMEANWLARQDRLIGPEASEKLQNARVAVIGLGGVGGAAAEALCRCGIGHLLLLDCDVFDVTNLNRQILATRAAIGRPKCEVARERVLSVNPACDAAAKNVRLGPENLAEVFDFAPDFVVDAVDCVTAKLALIAACAERGVPVVTSMGTGNRLSAASFTVGNLEGSAGNGCGLSRVMRHELRKRGLQGVPALYAKTPPGKPLDGGRTPASISFVPPVAGYLLAGYVVRRLLGLPEE